MPSAVPIDHLPASDSPSLALLHPSPEEKIKTWRTNASSWRGPLSMEAYLRREEHLANQPFTVDGGLTFWILVDTAQITTPRTVLASCESFRKRALLRGHNKQVREVVSHGIGSVFCNPEFRGKGYAGRMLKELGILLDHWQQKDGERADFTVLYSDIGKKFYSQLGWKAFPSQHIALDPVINDRHRTASSANLPTATPLHTEDLATLCRADEIALKSQLGNSGAGSTEITVALLPDVQTIQWHHAREEFAANELLGRWPNVKGAIVQGEVGNRVWCIFTRTFGNEQDGNTLNILRLVIEGQDADSQASDRAISDVSRDKLYRWRVLAAASVIRLSCCEAAEWKMDNVQLWNPSPLTTLAAREVDPSAKIIDRLHDSIASLRWHGPTLNTQTKVEWVGNEKYGWC